MEAALADRNHMRISACPKKKTCGIRWKRNRPTSRPGADPADTRHVAGYAETDGPLGTMVLAGP